MYRLRGTSRHWPHTEVHTGGQKTGAAFCAGIHSTHQCASATARPPMAGSPSARAAPATRAASLGTHYTEKNASRTPWAAPANTKYRPPGRACCTVAHTLVLLTDARVCGWRNTYSMLGSVTALAAKDDAKTRGEDTVPANRHCSSSSWPSTSLWRTSQDYSSSTSAAWASWFTRIFVVIEMSAD